MLIKRRSEKAKQTTKDEKIITKLRRVEMLIGQGMSHVDATR